MGSESGTHVIQTSSSWGNVAWVLAPTIITPTAQRSVIMLRDCHNSSCPDCTFNSYIGWESNEDTVLDSETVQDCTVANGCNLVNKQSDSLTPIIYTEKMPILLQLLLHCATVTCQLIFSCILQHQLLMLLIGISWHSWYIRLSHPQVYWESICIKYKDFLHHHTIIVGQW